MANLIITKPLLALRGVLIFPGMIANLDVGREKSIAAIDAAEATDKQIILVGQNSLSRKMLLLMIYMNGAFWLISSKSCSFLTAQCVCW